DLVDAGDSPAKGVLHRPFEDILVAYTRQIHQRSGWGGDRHSLPGPLHLFRNRRGSMKHQPPGMVALVSVTTHLNFVELYAIQVPKLRRSAMRNASGLTGPKRRAPDPLDPAGLRPAHAPYAGQLAHPLTVSDSPANLVARDTEPPNLLPRNDSMVLFC